MLRSRANPIEAYQRRRRIFLLSFLTFIFCVNSLKADYLRQEDLSSLEFSCYIENKVPVFCSNQKIHDPHLKIYLPLFKSVMINNKIHAFRIMATVENLSKRNLIGAKVRLKFKGSPNSDLEFIINQKIKYKMVSTTDYSHLIRSDVPKVRQTYDILHSAYYNADISDFEMAITELYFD